MRLLFATKNRKDMYTENILYINIIYLKYK